MHPRLEDKQKAITLRLSGKTFGEIRNQIPNLSKSTLSGWIKHVKLTQEQEYLLQKRTSKIVYNARVRAAWTRRQNRIVKAKIISEQARKDLPKLIKNPLFILGVSLYWAEGAKTQEQIQFSNSDPRIIKIMLRWFQEICGVPKEKIRVHIYIHEPYRNEKCEEFWSKVTGIPTSRFGKTTYKPTPHKVKKNSEYKGVCRIDIGNVTLFRKIMGWEQGVSDIFG